MLFELTAPDWHGKHSQWAWNLQTNPLLIDLHLIWPLKPIEGSQRMGEGRSPQRPQAASHSPVAGVKRGESWLEHASQPEETTAGQCHIFPFKTTGQPVWPLSPPMYVTVKMTHAHTHTETTEQRKAALDCFLYYVNVFSEYTETQFSEFYFAFRVWYTVFDPFLEPWTGKFKQV